MQKRHKDLVRTLVTELRHLLVGTVASDGTVIRGDLDRELERLGIAPDGTITPLDALANATPNEWQAHRIAVAQLVYCDEFKRASMRIEIIERAAYSWINRLLALRAMEARGFIDETLRTNPEYDGLPEALFILRQSDPERASGADGGRWAVLEDACQSQARSLPGLFALDDPATALSPSTPALIRCMTLVGGSMSGFTLAESDAAFADPDAIGWAYQFYQEEAKARIYAKLGSGGKAATRSEIAAATELFTEPYMVKWLLQNSLGRGYHEIYPDSALPATWEYYIKPDKLDTSTGYNLASLTVLDPCMGSGHFLREAFDMFVAMYREQFHTFSATEIADHILSNHLHGIDLDPRAAQLSALTLYLRAWELVRDERRKERKPGPGTYTPPAMNLATTPTSLNEGALQRHLLRHPQDMPLKPLLEGIFSGLEQADILGSLIRPKEYLDNAIAELQRPHTIRMEFDPEEAELRRTITTMANHDPVGLRQMLLERIADSFKSEAGNTDDVSAALFGREAEQGVRLLQLLDHRYAVVVTNPPYMGSKNMDTSLKKYVEKYYPSGKRDLYATFILRCIELCRPGGRVAMVTMQGWIFLRSFVDLRAVPDEKLLEAKKGGFTGILRETSIEGLVHLGRYAFSEIGNAIVAPVLFTMQQTIPGSQHRLWACRLIAPRPSEEQAVLLLEASQNNSISRTVYIPLQRDFLTIPETPLVYWLQQDFFTMLNSSHRLQEVAYVRTGLQTSDNERFTRCFWECSELDRWIPYAKGGGYCKWFGLEWLSLDWGHNGSRIKAFPPSVLRSPEFYFQTGLTYTLVSRGSLGMRKLEKSIFDVKGASLFLINTQFDLMQLAACLNSRVCSYFTRIFSQSLDLHVGYLSQIPMPYNFQTFQHLGNLAERLKRVIISSNQIERSFSSTNIVDIEQKICVLLHSIEAFLEKKVCNEYSLSDAVIEIIVNDTSIPAGWFPLIAGYDILPELPDEFDLSQLPAEFFDFIKTHRRINPDDKERASIKSSLRSLYELGPGAKNLDREETEEATERIESEEAALTGAHIPIPTETFLEEMSVKMQLHPISVYWLLEEVKAEGARCKPEELRLMEDRLSGLILRLLGHRWPKQVDGGEPIPTWASSGGIIPLVAGTGEATLAEQVRARLRTEDGELGVQQAEALLTELTGLSLEEWLRRRFFSRHMSQFKHRPIAWHLVSIPTHDGNRKRGGSQRGPAFECLLYYHVCSGDALARIRTQYVEPLLRAERQKMEDAYLFQDETTSVLANERIQELTAFVEKLRSIEEQGFACPELEKLIAEEPLDRWSGDGYLAPSNRKELLRNEQTWHMDINDGVRVNIAPLQPVGVLASDVLKPADAKKALVDRAHWRADERRWVRDGKLPRCGWMDERVPESPCWTEREPERIAEQIKLEQKRQALQNRRAEEVEL